MTNSEHIYEAIARSLRDFGYIDATAQMVRDTDEQPGMRPHGTVAGCITAMPRHAANAARLAAATVSQRASHA